MRHLPSAKFSFHKKNNLYPYNIAVYHLHHKRRNHNYEIRYRSLHCLQCILIPLHISLYSSLLCHLRFYVNLYILLHSHGKRVSVLLCPAHTTKKIMAAHGSSESFSFHRRPFFFAYTSNVSVFYSIHQVCISAHLFPKKALYPHNDLLRIALV